MGEQRHRAPLARAPAPVAPTHHPAHAAGDDDDDGGGGGGGGRRGGGQDDVRQVGAAGVATPTGLACLARSGRCGHFGGAERLGRLSGWNLRNKMPELAAEPHGYHGSGEFESRRPDQYLAVFWFYRAISETLIPRSAPCCWAVRLVKRLNAAPLDIMPSHHLPKAHACMQPTPFRLHTLAH